MLKAYHNYDVYLVMQWNNHKYAWQIAMDHVMPGSIYKLSEWHSTCQLRLKLKQGSTAVYFLKVATYIR